LTGKRIEMVKEKTGKKKKKSRGKWAVNSIRYQKSSESRVLNAKLGGEGKCKDQKS